MRTSASKMADKEATQRRREVELARLSRMKEELLLTKSWLDRKKLVYYGRSWMGTPYPKQILSGQPKFLKGFIPCKLLNKAMD